MRILHLMGTFHLGGSEEFVIDLAIWLRAAGHNVHVATVWTNPLGGEYANAQRQRLVRAGVPFSELGLSSFRRSIPLLPYRVTRVIDAFKPDLVQSHTDLPDFTVALTRPLRRIPLARTIHNSVFWPTHPHVGYFVERSFNDELLFAVSSDAMEAHDRFRAGYKLAPSCNRSVLAPGILVPTDGELAIRRASRNSDRKRRIAFLGRHHVQKGLDILLEAARLLQPHDLPNTEIVVHTEAFESLKLDASLSGIALPISVLPPLSDARDHLHEFDLIVMPSRYEGLGLLALEALAAGTPVIATRVAGLREALPPDWPLWVPPDDPAALAAKIRVFFAGHVDLAEIFARGRKWVERFSSECANQRYVDACDTYLGKLASQGGSAAKRAPSDL